MNMVETPSQIRHRRAEQHNNNGQAVSAKGPGKEHSSQTSSRFMGKSKALKSSRVSKEVHRKFYLSSVHQILLGVIYAASLWSIFNFDNLKPYREIASWFLQVQHVTQWGTAHYGYRDFFLVITAFIAIITARAVTQLWIYHVLLIARKDLDVKTRIRFTEQTWCLVYYCGAAIWGLILLQDQPYGWNAGTLWIDFPHYYIDPNVKQYYLTVLGYWFTQVFIIHIEDRRKDHFQMLTHHFVTIALVVGSYMYSYTRIGHLVMIMMDTVDVFLSLAKCSKYLRVPSKITDSIFIAFLVSWVLLRHFVYMYEMVYGAFPALDDLLGKCVFDVDAESLYAAPIQCFSLKVHYAFFALALALQGITIVWLIMILRIVMRVIQGDNASDTRSDSEDD